MKDIAFLLGFALVAGPICAAVVVAAVVAPIPVIAFVLTVAFGFNLMRWSTS